MNAEEQPGPVLLFDGECGLCNHLVRVLLRLDSEARLRFAPLQGPAAQEFLRTHGLSTYDMNTLVFVSDWARREHAGFLVRTDGAIAALRACGGFARVWGDLLAIVPRSMRDAGYRAIARVRYRIFGVWHACALPRPEWTMRFFE